METQSDHVWGAPQTEPAHWSLGKTLAAVGIAVVLAGAGAAVIYAASGTTTQHMGGPGFGGPPGGGPPGGFGGAQSSVSNALHGEFVVADGSGGYATELTQTGVVTEISDTAVTARSEDGFTRTYVITAETRQGRDPIEPGDTASIRGVTADGADTATVISPEE